MESLLAGIHAVVFDLDGTLVDNMALHAEAFNAFGGRHGLPPLTPADRARFDGRRNSEIFPILFGRDLTAGDLLEFEREKESIYREISRGRLAPVPGLTDLLSLLHARSIAVALATSAPEPNVAHTLRETGLAPRFPVIVRGDEVPRGKPAPDVFLAAAARVGVEPGCCLAFEDAPMGVAAAKVAGMRCGALTTSFPAAHLMALPVPPDFTCRDFAEWLARPQFVQTITRAPLSSV